jgi:hypothetical protein
MIIKFEIDSTDAKFQDILNILSGTPAVTCSCKNHPTLPDETFTPSHAFAPAPIVDTPPAPVAPAPAPITPPAPPVAPTPVPTVTSEAKPNPAITQAAPATLDDIRQMIMQITPTKRIELVQDVLDKFCVGKLSEIPEDKLQDAYNELHKFFEV